MLLHGQPGSATDWLQMAGRLPPQLHAVAADRPGYGSSQLPAGGFAANARTVLDDLDARGTNRAVLVGHSFGGGVALSAASLAPHRVEAVVLLASVGPACVNGWDRLLAAQYNPQILADPSRVQIASQLRNPASPVAKAIDGSANVIIAAINNVLHNEASG